MKSTPSRFADVPGATAATAQPGTLAARSAALLAAEGKFAQIVERTVANVH